MGYMWVNARIQHVDALSGAENTAGETYLIVGSDSRAGWKYDDGNTGARTDTIMVLHKAPNGVTSLISIPRDSYVKIPGHKKNKINAAFAEGGAQLLVETVEELTGLTIDAYMEMGLTGVGDLVDALGGVRLCYDKDVERPAFKAQVEGRAATSHRRQGARLRAHAARRPARRHWPRRAPATARERGRRQGVYQEGGRQSIQGDEGGGCRPRTPSA